MSSAIPLSDRITAALHTPARKVDAMKPLQVVAVQCCGVLRLLGLCGWLVGWDFFFLLCFFKIHLKAHSHQLLKAVEEFYWSNDKHACFYM